MFRDILDNVGRQAPVITVLEVELSACLSLVLLEAEVLNDVGVPGFLQGVEFAEQAFAGILKLFGIGALSFLKIERLADDQLVTCTVS